MPTRCENCAAPIQGGFCSECGQSTTDFNLPVAEFASEFVSEAFSLDSRLRLTLKPLFFKPGEVPRAYVGGHRARFVPPIRLYVFASFAMFLLMALGPGIASDNINLESGAGSAGESLVAEPDDRAPDIASADASEPEFGQRLQDRLVGGLQQVDENRASFNRDFFNRIAQSMIFLLPAFALLLKVVHRRRLYVHHLVFAIYHHSFVFFVVAFVALAPALGLDTVSDWTSLALFTIPVYLLLGMKRFYDESWVKTLAKFVLVSGTYFLLGTMTVLGALFVTLLSV